jgi:hypothetical protein
VERRDLVKNETTRGGSESLLKFDFFVAEAVRDSSCIA